MLITGADTLLLLLLLVQVCKDNSKHQLRRPGGGPILTPDTILGFSSGLKCFHFDLL